MNSKKTIPVNIIGGPLGSGKTTTINHLLKQKPPTEYWAILVNEYGLIGIDGALIENTSSQKSLEIKEVAGGCICCSAGFMFEVSLVRLLQRRPDRLLIEPTGLAALSGIIDTLSRTGIRESIDLRSIICLLDPAYLNEALKRETMQDQIDASDILLANRSDLATTEQLDTFTSWSEQLFPAKVHVERIINGQIPIELLDSVSNRTHKSTTHNHTHGTDHHHHHHHNDDDSSKEPVCDETTPIIRRVHQSSTESTFGWICWKDLIFDAVAIDEWLNRLANLPGSLRTKAVLRTNEGWWGFNFVGKAQTLNPSGYRRDSRIEVIIEGPCEELVEQFERELSECLVKESIYPQLERES